MCRLRRVVLGQDTVLLDLFSIAERDVYLGCIFFRWQCSFSVARRGLSLPVHAGLNRTDRFQAGLRVEPVILRLRRLHGQLRVPPGRIAATGKLLELA